MNTRIFVAISAIITGCVSLFADSDVTGNTFHREAVDTLLWVKGPSKITILESPEGVTVDVCGSESDPDFRTQYTETFGPDVQVKSRQKDTANSFFEGFGFIRNRNSAQGGEKHNRWRGVFGGLCIGLTDALDQPAPGGLQWSKSFDISWLQAIGAGYCFGHSDISLSLGFSWRNYRTTLSRRMVKTESRGVEWSGYPEGSIPKSSRLKIFGLSFPLLYGYSIPSTDVKLQAGAIFNFNTYASLRTRYLDSDGNEAEDFSKKIRKRAFTADLFGAVTFWEGIGIFARWSPYKQLESSPLNFRSLSVGVVFLL